MQRLLGLGVGHAQVVPRVFPGHVHTFDDACVYFEEWLDRLGGVIESDLFISTLVDDAGNEVELRFEELVVRFPILETTLRVMLNVDTDLTPTFYKFDFRRRGGGLIWRYDMHTGHEREDGVRWHVHEGTEQNRHPTESVDLQRIWDLVVWRNLGVTRP